MADHKWPVRVTGLELSPKRITGDEDSVVLTFTVSRNPENLTFSVPIRAPIESYDEKHAVAIARNYFHRVMASLAEQTADWKLEKDWFDANKAAPIKGR